MHDFPFAFFLGFGVIRYETVINVNNFGVVFNAALISLFISLGMSI